MEINNFRIQSNPHLLWRRPPLLIIINDVSVSGFIHKRFCISNMCRCPSGLYGRRDIIGEVGADAGFLVELEGHYVGGQIFITPFSGFFVAVVPITAVFYPAFSHFSGSTEIVLLSINGLPFISSIFAVGFLIFRGVGVFVDDPAFSKSRKRQQTDQKQCQGNR